MFTLSVPFVSLALSSALWGGALAVPFSPTPHINSTTRVSQLPLRKSVTLSSAQINGTTLVDLDNQRISALIASLFANGTGTKSKRDPEEDPLTYSSVLTTEVLFQNLESQTPLQLVIDTTFGLTLVGENEYQPPPPTLDPFTLLGGLSGTIVSDTVTLADVIAGVPASLMFGLVDDSSLRSLSPSVGILGLGSTILWDDPPADSDQVQTYMEAASVQGVANTFALSFTQGTDATVDLWIGGNDPSVDLTTFSMFSVPSTLQEKGVWGFDGVTITYGSNEGKFKKRSKRTDGFDNSTGIPYSAAKRHSNEERNVSGDFEENVRLSKGKTSPKDTQERNRKVYHLDSDGGDSESNDSEVDEDKRPHGSNGRTKGKPKGKPGKGGNPKGSHPKKLQPGGTGPSKKPTSNVLLNDGLVIVDTGSTFLQLEESAYEAYQSLTGATYDSKTKLLKLSSEQYNKLQTLSISITDSTTDGTTTIDLTNVQQVWPVEQYSNINGEEGSYYLIVSKLPSSAPDYFQVALGVQFLQNVYTVYDSSTGSPQIGIIDENSPPV